MIDKIRKCFFDSIDKMIVVVKNRIEAVDEAKQQKTEEKTNRKYVTLKRDSR